MKNGTNESTSSHESKPGSKEGRSTRRKRSTASRVVLGFSVLTLTASLIVAGGVAYTVHRGDSEASTANTQAVQGFREALRGAVSDSQAVTGPTAGKEASNASKSLTGAYSGSNSVEGVLSGAGLSQALPIRSGETVDQLQAVADTGAVAHYADSASLDTKAVGQQGNIILTAHRNTHSAAFHRVPELKRGETLTLELPNETDTYKVAVEARKLATPEDMSFRTLPSTVDMSTQHITLMTCGSWLSNERWVVILEKVASKPRK